MASFILLASINRSEKIQRAGEFEKHEDPIDSQGIKLRWQATQVAHKNFYQCFLIQYESINNIYIYIHRYTYIFIYIYTWYIIYFLIINKCLPFQLRYYRVWHETKSHGVPFVQFSLCDVWRTHHATVRSHSSSLRRSWSWEVRPSRGSEEIHVALLGEHKKL